MKHQYFPLADNNIVNLKTSSCERKLDDDAGTPAKPRHLCTVISMSCSSHLFSLNCSHNSRWFLNDCFRPLCTYPDSWSYVSRLLVLLCSTEYAPLHLHYTAHRSLCTAIVITLKWNSHIILTLYPWGHTLRVIYWRYVHIVLQDIVRCVLWALDCIHNNALVGNCSTQLLYCIYHEVYSTSRHLSNRSSTPCTAAFVMEIVAATPYCMGWVKPAECKAWTWKNKNVVAFFTKRFC